MQQTANGTATKEQQPVPMTRAALLPLPEKHGWQRVEGRLSGGYYRRPGSGRPVAVLV